MHRIIPFSYSFAFVLTSVTLAFGDTTVLPGATNVYRFDEGSGTLASDSIAGNTISLGNFPAGNAQWIPGMFGDGVNFTNANSYGITSSPIASNLFSVSFWARSNVHPGTSAGDLLTPQGDNWIGFTQTHGVGIGTVFDPNRPLRDVWENYVVTVDRTLGAASVYHDGVLTASGPVSLPALSAPWVFGHNQNLASTSGSFNGALDDVQFYNRILSPTDVSTLASRPPQPGVAAHLLAPAHDYGSQPVGAYATASTSFFIDPAKTDWVAWNEFPDLRAVSDTSPGQKFLGTYSIGVDDYASVFVTNPLGQTANFNLDQNGGLGAPIGQQSVIFGTASAAPDVVRGDNFGSPTFLNEAGAFNSIFTVAGDYQFKFIFQNIGGPAHYPDVYLLAHTVPEPGTISLASIGLVCLGVMTRRQWQLRRTKCDV